MITSSNKARRGKVILLKSSDNLYSRLLTIGKNYIIHPSLIPEHPDTVLFSVLMNREGEVCLRSYCYFPLLIKSQTRTIKAYIRDSLIFFTGSFEDYKIEPMLSTITIDFQLKVIAYDNLVKEQRQPLIEINCNFGNDTLDCTLLNDFFISSVNDIKVLSNKKLSTKRKREEECVICLDPLTQPSMLNKCKHEFCKGCIANWSRSSTECPICRMTFTSIISVDKESKIKRIKVKPKEFKALSQEEEEEGESWINHVAENCMKCQRDDDNYLMLVCDRCNYNICHTYCAGLDFIPVGNWYCEDCDSNLQHPKRTHSKQSQKTQSKHTKKKPDKQALRPKSHRKLECN